MRTQDAPATVARDPVDLPALLRRARAAQRALPAGPRNEALVAIAAALRRHAARIVGANVHDVAAEEARGTSAALIDRLRLDEGRIEAVAAACETVAELPKLTQGLLDRGWSTPDVRKVLGENWLRVYEKVWGA